MTDHLLLMQLADSAFPTGGFAHSWGLEAAFHAGEVDLESFVRESLWQAGRSGLPWLTAAYDEGARLEELDAALEAVLVNPVANRASRVQGRAFVSACRRAFPHERLRALDDRMKPLRGHQAPAMGAALAALDVARADAQRLYLFQTLRGVLSAAVRLGLTGPYAAQRLQQQSRRELLTVLAACEDVDATDAAQTSPILDILHGAHDRLYSRLFQS